MDPIFAKINLETGIRDPGERGVWCVPLGAYQESSLFCGSLYAPYNWVFDPLAERSPVARVRMTAICQAAMLAQTVEVDAAEWQFVRPERSCVVASRRAGRK